GRSVELSDHFFGISPNDHCIYLDVKQYLANQRQGTHKTKEKSELSGSTRKLKRQKGTGGARAGSIKNPLFHGGARIFGPRPRNYGFKLNKKVKDLARRSALSYKATENKVIVLESLSMDTPKTKEYLALLKNLGIENQRSLLVLNKSDYNINKSASNLQKAVVSTKDSLNTYQIIKADSLILSEDCVSAFQ
ncbi:MAG: 50S ribosomal protein L4, partial [Bacteroidetes bacterium]|nr:50S ribosomal protein L4 [Bacteroidota bacterium]